MVLFGLVILIFVFFCSGSDFCVVPKDIKYEETQPCLVTLLMVSEEYVGYRDPSRDDGTETQDR